MSGLSKRLQRSSKLSKIVTLPPQFFLKSNPSSSKCVASPLRKSQFELDNCVPLTPRYANILIDGYIHMPNEILTYNCDSDSALTLIQGMLCISLANPTVIETFYIQVVGNLSYDLNQMDVISENNELHFDSANKQIDIPILNLEQKVEAKEWGARNHYIPFEFLIDNNRKDGISLPPSFSSSNGSISYLVKVNLKFRNSSKQFQLIKPFLIRKCSLPYSLDDTDLLDMNPNNEGLHPLDHVLNSNETTTERGIQFDTRVEIMDGILYDLKLPKFLHPKQNYSPAHIRLTKSDSNCHLPNKCTVYIQETQTFKLNSNGQPKVLQYKVKVQDIPLKTLPNMNKTGMKVIYADPLLWLHSGLNLHHTVHSTYDSKLKVEHQLILEFKFPTKNLLTHSKTESFVSEVVLNALHPKLKDNCKPVDTCPPPYIKPPLYSPLLSPLLSPYHFNTLRR